MTVDYGTCRVRPALPDDAAALAPNLRKADLQEITSYTDRPPEAVLRDGIELGQAFAVELASGEVVALFGVAPTSERKLGSVWMMGSDALMSIRLTFLRHSTAWLRTLFSNYELLGNVVDERNTVHVRWLRWLGFRFLRRVPLGRNGESFLEFVRLKEPGNSSSSV